ncbi:MAG: hypothetical protein IJ088_06715 [Clostridia bacterium]|nr:hypothetical protein [Clostridia bacterium]
MMMRYRIVFSLILLMLPSLCSGEERKPGRIVLMTDYRQQGWGDLVQIGCMDEDGCLFGMSGADEQLRWPWKEEDKRAFLENSEELRFLGQLEEDDRFAILSLVSDVGTQSGVKGFGGCDMGTENTCAVRYSREGTPEFILLGQSGDRCYENTDPSAQALYRWARRLFPGIRCYAYGDVGIGPQGYEARPLATFLNISESVLDGAEISCMDMDCEAGPIPVELSEEESAALRELLRSGMVTGKANSLSVTGGTRAYVLRQPDGTWIGSVDLYGGLLVRGDGMYTIETGETAGQLPEK